MPINDFVDVQIVLGPGTTPEPAFGISALLANLTSSQFNEFTKIAGGLSTLLLGVNGYKETLATLGIPIGSDTYEQVDAHFTSFRKPNEMYLSHRGRPALDHDQRVVILEDSPGSTRANTGLYRVTAEGGPYDYESVGAPQVITATIADAGGGDAETGLYTIQDKEGNNFQYTSGTKQSYLIEIVNASAQEYSIDFQGVKYKYLAGAGDDQAAIRDGLLADLTSITAHPVHPDWVATATSTTEITVNTQEFGVDILPLNPLPAVDLTGAETAEAGETIAVVAAALVALALGNTVTYVLTDASPALVFTANLPGQDLGIQVSGRTAAAFASVVVTTDHRELVSAVRTALLGVITAGTHVSFVDSAGTGPGDIELEGTVAGVFVSVSVQGPPQTTSIVLVEVQSLLETLIAQQNLVTIVPSSGVAASDGLYEITLFGVTVSKTASGEDINDVRDALQASIVGSVPEVTATTAIGLDSFLVVNNTAGQPLSMALVSPNSGQAMIQAITVAVYGIGTDARRAFDDNKDWYFMLNGSGDDLSIVELGRELEGFVPGRSHVAQTADDNNRDVQLAAALPGADVGAQLSVLALQRTAVVYHPSEDGAQAYKAPFSAWVGDYSTDLPGQVNTHGLQLRGFQGRSYTTQQARNLQDRNLTFLDQFDALGAGGSQATNGGKNTDGRKFDLIRGADQATALIQVGMLNLLITARILPFTVAGVKEGTRVISEAFDDLVDQGFAIGNSLVVIEPDLSTLSAEDIENGIMNQFTVTFVVQAGTDKVIVRGTITQQSGNTAGTISAAA